MSLSFHPFRPRLLDSLRGYGRTEFAADLGAGITVGVVALPLAMAFAIASGLKPEAGLFTAIVAGFLISALGGSPVQIGGPAGAFIVVVYGIIERHGVANLLIATVLAGVLLFLMGWLKLGSLVRYIPVPIVTGFTNGIAVLIGLSQVKDLLGLDIDKMPADFFQQMAALAQHAHSWNPAALALGMACLALVVLWPKAYQAPPEQASHWRHRIRAAATKVPGTLIALALGTLVARWGPWELETIGSRFGEMPQSLPTMTWPTFEWVGVKQLMMPTLTIALLGAIESLLCARVADNLTGQRRHDPNQELMAQGIANIAAPLMGGMPATGTIARTVTNVRAGARTPIAGVVHALTVLVVLVAAAPLATHVPLATLAGILMFVAWNMGEWREFFHAGRYRLTYRTILFGTFILTVVFDLTVAVEVGLALACLFFIVRMSQAFQVRETPTDDARLQVFALEGALFFGAVGQVEDLEQRLQATTRHLILDLSQLIWLDTSGIEALRQLQGLLKRRGCTLHLVHATRQPLSLLMRSEAGHELGLSPDDLATLAQALREGRGD
jgi:sulfate permease, SulP family